MNTQLFIIAQTPVTPEGIICPIIANSVQQAIAEANTTMKVTLTSLGGGKYTDGTRNFFLFFGEAGQAQFQQMLDEAGISPVPDAPLATEPGMAADKLQSGLAQFYGSENFYRHPIGRFIYTDGIKFLADNAGGGAYWLLDLIGSYQPKLTRAEFQLWELKVDPAKHTAVITCREDSQPDGCDIPGFPPLVRQEIELTDFPLPEITLYLENNTLMLPSER